MINDIRRTFYPLINNNNNIKLNEVMIIFKYEEV